MNRYVVVGIAAVVTLLSGVGLFTYVAGADERASEGLDIVPVLVAQSNIAEGVTFENLEQAGLIVPGETIEASRPGTAVASMGDLAGKITTGPISEGQVIIGSMFALPEDLARGSGPPTFANRIDNGLVAVSFSVSGTAAVGGLVQPGDLVNLFVQVPSLAGAQVTGEGGGDPTTGAIVPVFQNLRIIAIGKVAAPGEGAEEAPANPGDPTYTVLVAPIDAARLLHLTSKYSPLMVLVPPDNVPIEFPPIIDLNAFPNGRTPEESAESLLDMQADGLNLAELTVNNADVIEFLQGATLAPVAPTEAPEEPEEPAEEAPPAEDVEDAEEAP